MSGTAAAARDTCIHLLPSPPRLVMPHFTRYDTEHPPSPSTSDVLHTYPIVRYFRSAIFIPIAPSFVVTVPCPVPLCCIYLGLRSGFLIVNSHIRFHPSSSRCAACTQRSAGDLDIYCGSPLRVCRQRETVGHLSCGGKHRCVRERFIRKGRLSLTRLGLLLSLLPKV